MSKQREVLAQDDDPLGWLKSVYRAVSGDEPDEDGVWLEQLEAWLSEVRQRLPQAKRQRVRQGEATPPVCDRRGGA